MNNYFDWKLWNVCVLKFHSKKWEISRPHSLLHVKNFVLQWTMRVRGWPGVDVMRCKTSLAAIARGHLASRIPFARGAARSFIRLERRFKWCEEFLILNLLSRGARSALSLSFALISLARKRRRGVSRETNGGYYWKGARNLFVFPPPRNKFCCLFKSKCRSATRCLRAYKTFRDLGNKHTWTAHATENPLALWHISRRYGMQPAKDKSLRPSFTFTLQNRHELSALAACYKWQCAARLPACLPACEDFQLLAFLRHKTFHVCLCVCAASSLQFEYNEGSFCSSRSFL